MAQNRRLIDADKLISEIRDDPNINGAHFARVKQHIENAPAVEAEPVRHGQQIPTYHKYYNREGESLIADE